MTGGQQPRWRIDDVLARTDLAELLDQLAEPAMYATRGRRWHCPVPEHDDRHASVTIHTDHRGHERWRCWSGDDNHRGDAVDLVRVSQRIGRVEAIDWLAQRAGMFPDRPLAVVAPKPPSRTEPKADVALDPSVVQYVKACERILWTSTGRPVREWLHGRGFSDELLKLNHVGADPGRTMLHRKRGLPYGGSIGATFPAMDEHGEITYVQTRYLNPGTGPKYDNPAAALATNPRLGWVQSDRTTISKVLLVCEGMPDALSAAQAGFDGIGLLGAQAATKSIAPRIADSIGRDTSVLCFADNDHAGLGWVRTLIEDLDAEGVTAAAASPPSTYNDLNDWLTAEPSGLQRVLTRVDIDRPTTSPIAIEFT